MKQLLYITVTLLIVVGCTQPDPGSLPKQEYARSAFLGRSISLFILSNGPHYAKQKLTNGNHIYAWNSKQNYRRYSSLLLGGEDNYFVSECEARITTDANGIIISVVALRDRAKRWEPRECRGLLN